MSSPQPFEPKPIFGIEIEIFVKVKQDVRLAVLRKRGRGEPQPDCWKKWNFNLSNRISWQDKRAKDQRKCVQGAIEILIQQALGETTKWKAESDSSLKEDALVEPPDPTKWCQCRFQFALLTTGRRIKANAILHTNRGCRDRLTAHSGDQKLAARHPHRLQGPRQAV